MPDALDETIASSEVQQGSREVFESELIKIVIAPLNLGNYHWCGVAVRVDEKLILYYDPMTSSYAVVARTVALERSRFGSLHFGGQFRVRQYNASCGIQIDICNCGVFLLLFAEEVIHGESVGRVNTDLLQYLRSRYFPMCQQDR